MVPYAEILTVNTRNIAENVRGESYRLWRAL